jgi:hypothetical protein
MQRREVRRVVGRDCQVYRSGDLLSAVSMRPPTTKERADTCIDEAGLVLEEILWSDGKFVSRRVAVSVEEPASLPDQLFEAPTSTVPVKEGGGSVRPLVDGSRPPGDFYELDSVPEGFESRGRYSVIPPQPENFGQDPTRQAHRRAEVTDVWVRGADVLVLVRGVTLGGVPAFNVDPAKQTIDAGDAGKAELLLGAQQSSVRAVLPGGNYVTITGTLPGAQLTELAGRIRKVEGGTLQFADEPQP